MAFCPKCGTAYSTGKFCGCCGAPLEGAPSSSGGFFTAAGDLSAPSNPIHTKPAEPVYTPEPAPRRDYPPAPEPVYTPKPEKNRPLHRISPMRELKLLLRQGLLVLVGEKRNLIISLLFPFIAAIITVWIAGEDMFVTYESTKSACFILVCAAIWGGLFNSIQSLVKERDNIKRDYVSGALRIECYMGSRAIIQTVLCAFQSLVLTMSIPAINWVHGNELPSEGVFGGAVFFEFYFTLFLVMLASDAMGLLISSVVKKEELASKLAPYILIAQLLFSGVLFKMEGFALTLSGIMISRWGMEAMGSICDLNSRTTRVYTELDQKGLTDMQECACVEMVGECPCSEGVLDALHRPEFDEMFEHEPSHLIGVLLIMIAFVVVSLVVADIMLHRVKKDGRD